jgi:hypothetical protein
MKFAFEIKTEPVTQAAVIVSVIAFALGSLVTITIYVDTPLAGISCAVVLVAIVYLALRLAPRCLLPPAISTIEPPLPFGAQMEGGDSEVAPPHIVPPVLQISPLPGSSDREEYFYDASLDNHHGSFVAACAFFSAQGHTIVVQECPDIAAFQAAHPFGLTLCPLANLPPCVFTKGYETLQALALTATAMPAAPTAGAATNAGGVFLSSLIDHYADIPSVLLLAQSSSEVVLCPISYCRDVFSTYLGKILDFIVVHWSFIFISHVSRLIVELL